MTHQPAQKSRATVWLLTVMAAPVPYLLSVPPLGFSTARPHADSLKSPDWVLAYAKPYRWTQEHTFLEESLLAYSDWWWDVIH